MFIMKNIKTKVLFLFIVCVNLYSGNCQRNYFDFNKYFTEPSEADVEWHGKWFPQQSRQGHERLHDPDHNVVMGVVDDECDNGMVNLTKDWDYSSADYTCYGLPHLYTPRYNVNPIYHVDHIPPHYKARHECMDSYITYDTLIPTFGTHRPLWPRYGEYRYVPKQRWIHSLEHGSLVMLYHPCANKQELQKLKNIVKSCLYRHIITPFQHLSTERPFGLVVWGSRLLMSKVDSKIVIDFIRRNALNGTEKTSKDGQFQQELIHPADIVSTQDDNILCPQHSHNL